jgi:hypothetical protein
VNPNSFGWKSGLVDSAAGVHAYRMGYRSQYEAPAGRATLKQDRLAARLGLDLDCPVKPKWMR